MTRAEILDTAKRYVTEDRAATHGDLEDNFTSIAQLWSIYLGIPITAVDVAALMTLFKVARVMGNPTHIDNWVDAAGYMACGGELASQISTNPCLTIKVL